MSAAGKNPRLSGVELTYSFANSKKPYNINNAPTLLHIERSFMSIDDLSLAHTCRYCKDNIVFAPKYRRKVFLDQKKSGYRQDIEKIIRI